MDLEEKLDLIHKDITDKIANVHADLKTLQTQVLTPETGLYARHKALESRVHYEINEVKEFQRKLTKGSWWLITAVIGGLIAMSVKLIVG